MPIAGFSSVQIRCGIEGLEVLVVWAGGNLVFSSFEVICPVVQTVADCHEFFFYISPELVYAWNNMGALQRPKGMT